MSGWAINIGCVSVSLWIITQARILVRSILYISERMNSRTPCSSSRIPSSNEDINLPFGFVFSPTDAELVEGYLLPKLKGKKLPSNYIVDLDNVYQYDPPNLPYSKFLSSDLVYICLILCVLFIYIFNIE